jgi:hypothetical protein
MKHYNKLYYGLSAVTLTYCVAVGANFSESFRAALIPMLFVLIPMAQKNYRKVGI